MWSPAEECLYWVDCSGKKIHRFDPERDAAHRHTEWSLDEHIGCLVLRQGGGFMAAVTLGQGWGSAQKPVIALLRAYLGRSRRSDACWSRTGTGQCTGTGRSESLRRLAI